MNKAMKFKTFPLSNATDNSNAAASLQTVVSLNFWRSPKNKRHQTCVTKYQYGKRLTGGLEKFI